MSLPTKAIDRLFERLAATYGSSWTRQWADVPMADAKSAWAHELSGYANRLESLAWVLENLPERCPNVIEFRNLARRAPAPELPRLPEPKADPARLKAELSKLGEIRAQVAGTPATNGRDWARRVMAKNKREVSPYAWKCAEQALGIKA